MATNSLIQVAMARLGLTEAGDKTKTPAATAGERAAKVEKEGELGHFEQRLGRILARRQHEVDDRVYIIALDKWRVKMGDRWQKVCNNVHATVRAVLEQRLNKQSLYVQRDEDSYLVVMGGVTAREAQLRCLIIGEEILERLAGRENVLDLVGVKTVDIDEDGQLHFQDLPPLRRVLEEIPDNVSANASRTAEVAAAVREEGTIGGLEDVKFIYRPMLAVRTKVISTFMSLPIRQMYRSFFLSGYDVLGQGAIARQYLDLDRLTARTAGNALNRLLNQGAKSLLALPVHYETLADSRRRSEYVNICAKEFHGVANRIIYELVGLPDGIPQVRLTELVSLLRPHGRAIIARFPLGRRDFTAFRIGGLHAVGIDLYNNSTREENMMRDIEEFVVAANQNKLKTFALGVRTTSLYTAIVAAGYDYAAGHALTSVAQTPDNAYVYRMDLPFLAAIEGKSGGKGRAPTDKDEDDIHGADN